MYPGLKWQGRTWNRSTLKESYKPWREVERRGARIHIGEFGCFRHTPNDVAVRWLADLISIYREFGWGSAMWQFQGPFGLVEHGRAGATFEPVAGFEVDRALLDLMLESRS